MIREVIDKLESWVCYCYVLCFLAFYLVTWLVHLCQSWGPSEMLFLVLYLGLCFFVSAAGLLD